MSLFRNLSERVARKTTRRGLVGESLTTAFGALAGAAAGSTIGVRGVSAGRPDTVCIFPRNTPCPCQDCFVNGVCAKPCVIDTIAYSTGCWVTDGVTCCDCKCPDAPNTGDCGCGTDWHNDTANCPDGLADS